MHSASGCAFLVLFWSLSPVCCLARCLFPDAHRRLRYRPSCPTTCAWVRERVLARIPSAVVGQQLPCSVIFLKFEESVCGFQAKQVSLLTSQSVGAIHEQGRQADRSVGLCLCVCSQAPTD